MESENKEQYEWLALRCQSGDPGAFEDLIAVMERPLLYYAASLTGSVDSALDVLQEVWMKAFRGIRKLKNPGCSAIVAIHHHAWNRCRSNPKELLARAGRRRSNTRIFRRPRSRRSPKRMLLRFMRR